MTKIEIIDESYTMVTRHGDPNDEWDGDDTETSHHITGFRVLKNGYSDLEVDFKLTPGKPYYLLYAIYSTGDSFHHEEGKIEYIGLYKSLKDAEVNQKLIEKHYKETNESNPRNFDSMFSVELISPSGVKYKQHVPWNGYFESLTSVEVIPILQRS